jgi:phosphate uptake regulator
MVAVQEKIRSVYKLGDSTLVMSLPKSWAESVQLKKGDKILVRMKKDGTLSLFPSNMDGNGLREVEIPVNISSEGDLERKIISKYIDGYSLIKLKAGEGLFKLHHHNVIRGIINKLIGLNIIELTPEEVIIQSLLDPSELPIRKGLERTHSLATSMYKGALKALMTSDDLMAKNILRMRTDLDGFYYLVLRQLRSSLLRSDVLRRLNVEAIDCLDYLTASQIIIRVAKFAEQILKNIVALRNFQLPNDILVLINLFGEKAINVIERSFNAFINNDTSNISIKSTQSLMNSESLKLNKKLAQVREEGVPCEVMCHVIQIVDRIERIWDQGIELAETTIYRSIQ